MERYPEFTNKDLVFDSLFSVQDPELNSLTIEALQIILLNLSIIIMVFNATFIFNNISVIL
jgi:hypothetical protein